MASRVEVEPGERGEGDGSASFVAFQGAFCRAIKGLAGGVAKCLAGAAGQFVECRAFHGVSFCGQAVRGEFLQRVAGWREKNVRKVRRKGGLRGEK